MSDTKYKLRWASPWNWRDFDTVRMEISVGQEYHEGDKLQTAVNWAKKNFSRAVVIVGDSIQGYNLSLSSGIKLQEAFAVCTQRGDEWLKRNEATLDGLEITRWSDWLSHKDYALNRAKIGRLYTENEEFRKRVERNINGVWERRSPSVSRETFFKVSEQFILEESAVFACAYKELGGISAYPGDFLDLWDMFVGQNIEGAPEGFRNAHHVRIQFKRRPEFKMVG